MMIADVPLPPKNPETTPEVVATYCLPSIASLILMRQRMTVCPRLGVSLIYFDSQRGAADLEFRASVHDCGTGIAQV